MGNEYEFIKRASNEKEMTEEAYNAARDLYAKKSDELGNRIRKLILIFLGVYAASFVLLYVRLLFSDNAEYINSCYILLAELMLAIFFFDPKEDVRHAYEKDKRILLDYQKNKITAMKIRLGLVIGFGALFGLLNIIWWAVFGLVPEGESTPKSSLLLFMPAYAIDYSYIESETAENEDLPKDDSEAEEAEIDEIIENSVILRIGSPKALVKGEICHIDEENRYLSPFIDENDRTLVPVRFIAETLGFGVEFDFETESRKIMICDNLDNVPERQNLPLVMYIGDNILEAGALCIEMDCAPVLSPEGRTFIPARPFAESLFMNIYYAESERIIIITDLDIGEAEPAAKRAAESLPVWPIDMSKVLKEWKNWPANPDGTYHAGADFAIDEGSDVYSVHSGIVEVVSDLGDISYGKYIVVKSVIGGRARYIYYGHLSEQAVKTGDSVRAGDIIGKTGNTGNSTGPHLHFEVRDENKAHGSAQNPALNPYDYLP